MSEDIGEIFEELRRIGERYEKGIELAYQNGNMRLLSHCQSLIGSINTENYERASQLMEKIKKIENGI